MKTLDDARVLAEEMLELGRRAGKEVTCLLTDMDQPLGRAVGNALEIREALDTVRGEGPADFTELVLDACARLLALLRSRDRRRRGPPARRGCRSRRLGRTRPTSAGSGRRAATPIPRAARRAPVRLRRARTARRLRHAPRRARCRRRGARAGCRPADEGRRDRPRRRRRSASPSAVTPVLAGDDLAEVHARDDAAAAAAVAAVLAAYDDRRRGPAERGILLDVMS